MTQKHAREAMERARSMGLQCTLETSHGHYKLRASKDGVQVAVPLSSSPKDANSCVNMTAQQLRRRFAERGVTL